MLVSLVIARVIAESGAPMPALTDDAVLMIKRTNVVVGDGCDGDVLGPRDAGVDDAPEDAAEDAGPVDAGVGDAGTPDAGCTSIPGDAITLVVQPRFMTNPQGLRFALLFVTPSRPIVETKSSYLFEELATVTAPKIEVRTRRVEDPYLGKQCSSGCGAPEQESSGGCESGASWDPPSFGDGGFGDGGLVVETIGPYEVLRAEPADASELATWLTGLDYRYDQADLDAVAPYIALDYTVIAVRVAVDQATTTTFAPIALTYPGSELRIPVAVGTASASVATTVYIAAEGRYDLPGADVPFADRTSWGGSGFLTRNDVVLDSDGLPASDPVAQRVANDPYEREVIVEEKIIRVPVSECDDDIGCCGTGRNRVRPDMIAVVLACGFIMRRTRRRRRR